MNKRSSFADLCDAFKEEAKKVPPANFRKALKKDLRSMRAGLLGDAAGAVNKEDSK
jgi:hypothetical protein